MSALNDILDRVRGMEPEKVLGLRPPYPPVVLQVRPGEAALVRLRRRRRGRPLLEAHQEGPLPEACIPTSIFQSSSGGTEELVGPLRDLFDRSGTRPGKISLILPDNLAKVSLLTLPERPASRRHLDELVRAKMRRGVPFKLEEARISYQLLPGDGRGASVLVLLVRGSIVERFETALSALGARAGLVDISTPNLVNLYRATIAAASKNGGDAALLNCSDNYFSLVIVRNENLIFFRCKTFAIEDPGARGPNGILAREVGSSISYYREKLAGTGLGKVLVRTVGIPIEEVSEKLAGLDLPDCEPVAPVQNLDLADQVKLDAETAQRLAPAIGAALGRGR